MPSSPSRDDGFDILDDLQYHLSRTLDHFSIVAVTDDRGVILYANDNFCKISEHSREELIGQTHRIVNSSFHPKSFFTHLWETVLGGETWTGEVCNRTKYGQLYWVDTQISPIDVRGKRYFIAVRNDITDRKLAQDENLRQEKQLLQADKMSSLGILTSGIAHEINNPNHLIMSNNELLEKVWSEVQVMLRNKCDKEGDFELAGIPCREMEMLIPQMFERIRGGTERIKNIVEGLKHFAREDHQDRKEQFSLNSIVESALPLVETLIRRSTHGFTVKLEQELPPMEGSFQQIEQVFINFMTNACQALEDAGQGITVRTESLSAQDCVALIVEDEGIGIPDDIMKKIMDPFFTTKHDMGGTGLGLFVSYGIVQRHGGQLHFDSPSQRGCRATMIFPIARTPKSGSEMKI